MSHGTTRGSRATTMPAPAAPPDAHLDTTGRRVLVVDDNEANRYAVGYWLREAGFQVAEADTGESALVMAKAEPVPSLVVLDIRLPDTTGFDVLRQLREDPRTAHTPVVHVTASFTTSEWRAHGLEAGADAYLTHPIEPRELVATVRALLRVRIAEERVRTAAAEWTATLDALDEPVLLVDVQGRIARANRAASALLHRVRARVTPHAAGELPDDAPLADVAVGPLVPMATVARRVLDEAARAGAHAHDEESAIGDEIHVDDRRYGLVGRPVRDADGVVRGVVCVLSDVTERVLLLDEAEEARRIAETANRAKSTFLATMSHEIRTPINAILGYADLLDLEVAGALTAQQRDYLKRVQDSSRHLLTLVDDVLDLAKVDAGQLRVRHEIGSLASVVDGALALVTPSAVAKGLELRVEGVTRELMYRGDEHRVRQVLLNLLTNAVKFTPRGGAIVIAAGTSAAPEVLRGVPLARYASWTWLTVRDTGIGIPAERHEAVFDPFVQVEDGLTRTRGGTGLGLTISRQLARLMDGDLLLESGPGAGSVFTLWLPATEPALRVDREPAVGGESATPSSSHASGFAPGLSARGAALAGAAITDGMSGLLQLVERRLREDVLLQPVAGRLAPLVLLGHHQALLSSIASALVAVTEEHEAGSFRDGARIRHTIAELHGAQRQRLGWEPSQLLREFSIVRDELERLVDARLAGEEVDRGSVRDMVRRLVDQAAGVAMHALPSRPRREG